MPVWSGIKQEPDAAYHRYICLDCKKTFMEDIPFKYSEARCKRSPISTKLFQKQPKIRFSKITNSVS